MVVAVIDSGQLGETALVVDSGLVEGGLVEDGFCRSGQAQLPCTQFNTMVEAQIPPADAERLIHQFNRISFPIMRDDRFVDILKDVVATTPSEQGEARSKERLDTIN